MRSVCLSILFCFLLISHAYSEERGGMENPRIVKESRLGVLEFLHWNHPWNNYKYPGRKEIERCADEMKKAGVGWVRCDFLWQDLQPKRDRFDFSRFDMIVDVLSSRNIQILGLLNYGNSWASRSGAWNAPADSDDDFVAYVQTVIRRYKDKIKYWEIWNEPDSNIYWYPQDGLKRYTQLLKKVYPAAKAIDADCYILNGGLANGVSSINKLYDNEAKDSFDILNVHFFQSPKDPQGLAAARSFIALTKKIMKRNNDDLKPIWITETGCPGVPDGRKTKMWWMGENPNEEEQARWVKSIMGIFLDDPAVGKVFWAFFRDCKEHWGNGTDYLGLIRWDYSHKPGYKSFQDVAQNQQCNN